MKKTEKNKGIKPYSLLILFGYCLLISIIFLLLSTKSSPLYPFNDWVDANVSFTIGKGMMHGKVVYRDLFDQRGPLFYFTYGLGYLISHTDFLGIYILEVVSFAIFLFFCSKIITLYLDKSYSFVALPLIAGSILNLDAFAHGGSPEEFSLPLLAFSLYYLLRYFKEIYPKNIPDRWLFINGIVAGCILWIKYSFLGFWIGWMASILLGLLIQKQFKKIVQSAVLFLLGMAAATIPWILYFGLNHAIHEWIQSYFVINLTAYSQPMSLFSRAKFVFYTLYGFRYSPIIVGLMAFGLFVFLSLKKYIKEPLHKISVALCFILLLLTVYGGGQAMKYYFLIAAPLIIFGFIVLLGLYSDVYGAIESKKVLLAITFILTMGTLYFVYRTNQNIYLMKIEKENLVQYKYAKVINETENATLLTYGWLDSGFFTTTDTIPIIKFFHQPNIEYSRYPEIKDEQNRYVKEAITDYVVYPIPVPLYLGATDIPNLIPDISENYEFIRDDIQEYEGVDYRYLLFRKIS